MAEIDDITSYKFFQNLIRFPFVDRILLYGSRAKEAHQRRADIDLAIECPQASDEEWNTVLTVIDNADTLLEIDCVRFDGIQSKRFKQSILNHHKVLFDRSKIS